MTHADKIHKNYEDVNDDDNNVNDDEDGAEHQNARNSSLACAIIAWARLK